ncbi:MAG: hypothetical protein FJ026_01460 [Chloroflexi bacterium]|nr:hypothetical protein [Chloroflexota bacterium]
MSERHRRIAVYVATFCLACLLLLLWGSPPQMWLVRAGGQSKLTQPASLDTGQTRRPSVKITGWVSELSSTHIRLGAYDLRLDAHSTVLNVNKGMYVAAVASVAEDGQWYARSISPVPVTTPDFSVPPAADDGPVVQGTSGFVSYPIEFRGIIREIDPRYWVVGNRLVFVTDRTAVQGRPELDALAEVKGTMLFQDVVVARSVKVTVPGAYAEVEFEGIIESLSSERWTVNGVVVTISPVTVIQGAPAFGLLAQVQGVLQPDGSVLAQKIVVKTADFTGHIDLMGLVESIAPTLWVVAGKDILVDAYTFVDDSRAAAEVGMWAQVRALSRRDGSLLALRIRLSRPN